MTAEGFDRETLGKLAAPGHSTTIWVVVADEAVSVRGEGGRWYQEARVNPEAALRVDDGRVPCRAVRETDAATIEGVSGAFRDKYEASYPGPTAGMGREEVLQTTLRSLPA